jgi:hypothetical protein
MFETGMNHQATKESKGMSPVRARYRNQAETGTQTETRTGVANREHNEKREISHSSNNDGFFLFGLKISYDSFFSLILKLMVMISFGLASKPIVGLLVEHQNQGGGGFLGLALKIGSYGLVI